MLQSKKGNMIISLILAIALWMYVVGETNPEITKSFRTIPITLENTQTLADSGLAVVRSSEDIVSVTLSGKRSVVNKIKTTDITATADLSDAVAGDNQIRVDIKVPSEVEIRDQTPSKITVTVEERVTEEKEVRAVYNGTPASGSEPTTKAIEPETVEVTGARSRVDKVLYVGALCDVSDIVENETSIRCRLAPMNADGNEVENVTLSENKAVVNTILYYTKEVGLAVDVEGKDAGGYDRSYEVPDRVTIKGTSEAIRDVTEVACRKVDLSNVNKSEQIRLHPQLPAGVELAGSSSLVMKVSVSGNGDKSDNEEDQDEQEAEIVTKDFSVSGDSVDVLGLADDLDCQVQTGDLTVTVSAAEKHMKAINADSIYLSVDLKGLEAGTHDVRIDAEVNAEYEEVSIEPQDLSVEISQRSQTEETDEQL